jgi:hypothetical protein
MKTLFFAATMFCVVAFGGITAAAQCDRNTESPIRCGFYDEGYLDGVDDATSNRNDDYRRHRNKYSGVNQYEDFYRRGYSEGYDSVRGSTRWTGAQRNAYDAGYNQGQNDRRYSRGNEGGLGGRYDANIGLYYQQGYDDGFNNRSRRYDFPLETGTGGPTFPGPGSPSGNATWNGRVDDRANIIIRGGTMRTETVSGSAATVSYQNMGSSLPRRAATVSARLIEGRGTVSVIQQPNRSNDFTAIVQIYDRGSGAANYRVEMNWERGRNAEEPYQSGSVRWRGRVDQKVNIVISGNDVRTEDVAGTGLSSVYFDINGYLAARAGSVRVSKRNGRGTVSVIQQPSWNNDFTAIVQVFDPGGGADSYELDIEW